MSPFCLGSLQLLCFVWGIFCRVFCLPLELAADFFTHDAVSFLYSDLSLSLLFDAFWIFGFIIPQCSFLQRGYKIIFSTVLMSLVAFLMLGVLHGLQDELRLQGAWNDSESPNLRSAPTKPGSLCPIIWLILPLQGGLSEPLEVFFMEENSLWWCWHHHCSTIQFLGDHAEPGIRFRPQRMPGLCASPLIHLISLLTDLLLPSYFLFPFKMQLFFHDETILF